MTGVVSALFHHLIIIIIIIVIIIVRPNVCSVGGQIDGLAWWRCS